MGSPRVGSEPRIQMQAFTGRCKEYEQIGREEGRAAVKTIINPTTTVGNWRLIPWGETWRDPKTYT